MESAAGGRDPAYTHCKLPIENCELLLQPPRLPPQLTELLLAAGKILPDHTPGIAAGFIRFCYDALRLLAVSKPFADLPVEMHVRVKNGPDRLPFSARQ